MLRFWSSKLHFWKKSPLKDRQKGIGMLKSSVGSTCHFWRKPGTKASFLSFKLSCLKEVSQKSFDFEFQSFIFECFLRKCRAKALFLWVFEGSLAEKLRFWFSKLHFWFSHLTPIESHFQWTSNRLTCKPFESHRMTLKTIESRSSRIWNHLNLITWITPRVNLKPLESQIKCNSIQLNLKPMEYQISWLPNHLKFKSTDNHFKPMESEISKQLNLKSIEIQKSWIWNQRTFEPIEFHTFFL